MFKVAGNVDGEIDFYLFVLKEGNVSYQKIVQNQEYSFLSKNVPSIHSYSVSQLKSV